MPRKVRVLDFLSQDGAGVNNNANGDYSATPTSFKYIKPDGIVDVYSASVFMSGDGKFRLEEYGMGPELVNGWNMYLKNAQDQILATVFPATIKRNENLMQFADVFHYENDLLGAREAVKATFNAVQQTGQPLSVDFQNGEYIEVVLNDDFSSEDVHNISLSGKYRSKEYNS